MSTYLCSVSPALVFWSGAVAGGTFMAITVMVWLAVYEKLTSRKLLKQAESGVDTPLPDGRTMRLLFAPEAAAQ
jgi:hypothetical protein